MRGQEREKREKFRAPFGHGEHFHVLQGTGGVTVNAGCAQDTHHIIKVAHVERGKARCQHVSHELRPITHAQVCAQQLREFPQHGSDARWCPAKLERWPRLVIVWQKQGP